MKYVNSEVVKATFYYYMTFYRLNNSAANYERDQQVNQ